MDEVACQTGQSHNWGIFENVKFLAVTNSYEPHGSMLKGLSFSPGLDDCFCQKKKGEKI